jgi:hypothetical protein
MRTKLGINTQSTIGSTMQLNSQDCADPNSISGLVYHMSARNINLKDVALPANNANISTFKDLSTTGADMVYGSGTQAKFLIPPKEISHIITGTTAPYQSSVVNIGNSADSLSFCCYLKLNSLASDTYALLEIVNNNASTKERFVPCVSVVTATGVLQSRNYSTNLDTTASASIHSSPLNINLGEYFFYFVEVDYVNRVVRMSTNNKTVASATPSWSAGAVPATNSTIGHRILKGIDNRAANISIKEMFLYKNRLLTAEERRRLMNYCTQL